MRSTGRTDVAIRNAAGFLGSGELDEGFWYSVKRRLLGPPMVNEELRHQRLSKPLALGVLSPDGISSSAYGSEEILIALLPLAGLAAFTIILPMTLVILVVMALVVLSYREVVMVYIRPGGSYVVARENFGPRVAQIAAVALLIDYVVTVAVQVTAGTAAVVSAVPALGPYTEPIVIGVILLMCYGNLRGIKEAGRIFALPTFLFSGAVILMIVVGLVREVLGDLPKYDPHALPGTYPIGAGTAGIITFAMILTLLRAFANGGASLTGIEAVSDAVGAFRPPEGINARQVLVTEGVILGFLVAGISWLAHATLATPRNSGYPTVLAQEAQAVFGSSFLGHALFLLVQAATALILFTGGNTSFNGFPFLASYVAGDAFLPRWLLKRGHRLVFSNAIIGLTIVSIVLIIIRGPKVNNLVPLYAIGVFTAFSMAGFGMARYHKRNKEPGWRHKRAIALAAGVLTSVVVAIFAVVKFTEGAWLVVVLFPILWFAFIRLNREYTMEAEVLERVGSRRKPPEQPNYPRRTVFLLVDSFDLATLAAVRYARSLRPDDAARGALRHRHRAGQPAAGGVDAGRAGHRARLRRHPGPPPEQSRRRAGQPGGGGARHARDRGPAPAQLLAAARQAPARPHRGQDRRRGEQDPERGRHHRPVRRAQPARGPARAAARARARGGPGARRRPGGPRSGLRHDARGGGRRCRPAGRGSRPGHGRRPAGRARGDPRHRRHGRGRGSATGAGRAAPFAAAEPAAPAAVPRRTGSPAAAPADGDRAQQDNATYNRPAPPPGVNPIGSLTRPGRATVAGRVRAVEIRPVERNSVLAAEISDATGDLTALFYGRSHIPGLVCGARVRFRGAVGIRNGHPVMTNPAYELLAPGDASPPDGEQS